MSAKPLRSFFGSLLVLVMPLVLPAFVFVAVLATEAPLLRASPPHEARRAYCTWACHNVGCSHRTRLPAVLTADKGLYGATIHALFRIGRGLSADRRTGYGAANLLVLCVGWPASMYGLVVVALRQRIRIVALRNRGRR